MKLSAILLLAVAPSVSLAFSSNSKPSFATRAATGSSTTTSLNLKVAKDLYPSSPLEINYVHDETGEKLHFGTTDSVYDKIRSLDYNLVTDEMVENIVQWIDEDKLLQYLEAFETSGRGPTGLVVVDVRDQDEVDATGKFTPHTYSFPYSKIREEHPFHEIDDDDDWFDEYGFEYVEAHERLIVVGDKETSKIAAKYLAFNSYIREILCYTGGSEEWFADLPAPE
eukprot:CAMPEP_0119003018 /NCGR_PEP_ID=MMETSP1176-20130426/295_1 /TAXON_ID=265551 /ORGANISM="Synedropsis recta cf, Strain CCMP1620" /LENGTH=224 /DNA_ID=CAMNT_0006954573 /DNA_START=88 /DNA_END=762 /DNA_ORIENTATION=+